MGTTLSRSDRSPRNQAGADDAQAAAVASPAPVVWWNSTFALGMAGSLLLAAAFPPLGLGMLVWVAPVPWLLLALRPTLSGRHPCRVLWLCGLGFWLLAIHWIRLPHPATSLGWLALSAYLACYLPLFIALTRSAVHKLRVPLWVAAPITWTGLELARAHLLTGFLMAALGHALVDYPVLIQISDLAGGYAVSFLIMLVAAGVTLLLPARWRGEPIGTRSQVARWLPLEVALLAVVATCVYGTWRLGEPTGAGLEKSGPRVALVQGNSLATWKQEPGRQQQIMADYIELSHEAVEKARETGDGRPLDLIVWPETMFRSSLLTFDPGYELPSDIGRTVDEIADYGPRDLASLVDRLDVPVLVGVDRVHHEVTSAATGAPAYRRYNSSAFVDRQGQVVGTYDKVHRVMFGEYIPLAERIPLLYDLTPLTGGIEAGTGPVAFESDGVRYAPSICYETVIPHVIRRQMVTLTERGERPHVLVNLTNDAWYWGSSELDMHLACGVFRAVECRRPLVVAANGGISASIDSCGRVVAESPRQTPDVIIADVVLDARESLYVATGDWFAGACLVGCIALAVVGWRIE